MLETLDVRVRRKMGNAKSSRHLRYIVSAAASNYVTRNGKGSCTDAVLGAVYTAFRITFNK